MNAKQIQRLAYTLEASNSKVEIISTHISWVLLLDEFVYKIKKPLLLSFLDFSTIEKRKYYCDRELILNQRLTTDMYLKVLPIWQNNGDINIDKGEGRIVDYCLKMKRIDNSKEMRALLSVDLVKRSDVVKLAHQLVRFHQDADIVKGVVNYKVLWDDFEDITQVMSFIEEHMGQAATYEIKIMLNAVKSFLKKMATRIEERDLIGYTRDCHGDLHTGNIFLLDDPIIFDCIEFNDHFRQIDLLNELAFLSMDLEFYNRQDLNDSFLQEYLNLYPVIENEDDNKLFLFYKLYRCNVKVKVNAIKCLQSKEGSVFNERLILVKRYFKLMMCYYDQLCNN